MSLVNKIKKMFPKPSKKIEHGYCVGGAVVLYNDGTANVGGFPDPSKIADALMNLNEELDNDTAESYAELIIDRNDKGKYARAWDAVESALEWNRMKMTKTRSNRDYQF